MSEQEKRICEMARIMCQSNKPCLMCDVQSPCWFKTHAKVLIEQGYRKESEVVAEVLAKVKKWLCQIAINNVGCAFEGDFSKACVEIISRLDGLERFVQEIQGE